MKPVIAAAAGLSLAVAACGGASRPTTTTHVTPARAVTRGPASYLSASDLERQVGNAAREGLYRLAVMSQPSDDATDLGQDLPTGTLRRVACTPAGGRPAGHASWPWRCTVRWATVAGRPRVTRYTVRLLPTGCFSAGAQPRLPEHRDATIASYSEHPLNALVSTQRGC